MVAAVCTMTVKIDSSNHPRNRFIDAKSVQVVTHIVRYFALRRKTIFYEETLKQPVRGFRHSKDLEGV